MMIFQLYPQTAKTRIFKEPRSRCRLPYYTSKEIRALYPHGDFIIVGEIGSFERPPNGGDQLCTDDGKTLPILPRGSSKWPIEWVVGYIAVEKNIYIAAVRSILPTF
jgi:phospholipase/carboxylesterase